MAIRLIFLFLVAPYLMLNIKKNTFYSISSYTRKSILLVLMCMAVGYVFGQAPNISYTTPQTYVTNTAISPLTPNNTGGAIPATIYGQVSTFAGGGFNSVTGVAEDAAGNIYVDDWGNNEIKKISPTGVISLLAGSGAMGSANGLGAAASFFEPDGIVLDPAGNVYVADAGNNLIRKITPAGLVTTLAGSGAATGVDGTGTSASFYSPRGLAIDAAGNLYVADQANNKIRKITPAGVVTTIAGSGAGGFTNGTGTGATFNTPTGVGIDAAGNLYIADAGNNAIRKITPSGVVTTFATGLNFPREIRIDATGNCYVTDQNSNTIKRISPAGIVTTIAGSGQAGATNGNGVSASFNGPLGLVFDGNGNLYVGDDANNLVRKVVVSGYTIDKPLPAGLTFDPTTGIITGTPTVISAATIYTITAYNGGGGSITTVSIAVTNTALPPAIITFTPPANTQIDASNILYPGATSNNSAVPITYTSSNPAVAYVGTDGLVHVIAPGTTNITAYQAAGGSYGAATPVTVTFNIKQNQIIVFPVIGTKGICQVDFPTGVITSNPAIPVIYTSSNPAVATVSQAGIIHIITTGTTIIYANQNGDNLHNAAPQQQQTLTVVQPATPVVAITANNTSVCQGDNVTFIANINNLSSVVNPSYQWQVNGVNVGTNSNTYNGVVVSSDVISCTVTNNDVCVLTASASISNISTIPNNTLSVNIQSQPSVPICSGSSITFTATPNYTGANSFYQWQVNGLNAGTNSATFTSNSLSNGDLVTCMFTNASTPCLVNATVASNSLTVNIVPVANPAPSVTIMVSANNVYAGTSVMFTATTANAGNNPQYQWQVNGVNAGSNSAVFTTNSLNNGDLITCIILSTNNCAVPVTSTAVAMTILPPLNVIPPNTFTPNGDAINDFWSIPALESYPNCIVNIYNRYGTQIFQSKGYSKPWDGLFNGKQLPVGTYYYVINLDNNKPQISGHVTIIR